ncbi:signal peptidase I [Clostridioides mangenotii]|uniref:signal peptidase I n=1 Tax=Metaclostridioides mangenotii TaxID=1540 RepID=UPI001C1149C1|nr:signal peptidase I [Clostridioides mangenotii]MBU5307390.1 signal peptidase I [Clostridioides mangenotii]
MSENVKKEIFEWIKVIITALILAFVITRFIIPSRVQGESMFPTLHENDYLIVNRMTYKFREPEMKDIIVFKSDILQENGKSKKDLVKRVIAVEGDHIKIQDSNVYVNGKLLDEKVYIHDNYTSGDIDMTVPKGKIFAMGDNRERSLDSRAQEVGLVDEDSVIGKVMVRLYPFNQIGGVN